MDKQYINVNSSQNFDLMRRSGVWHSRPRSIPEDRCGKDICQLPSETAKNILVTKSEDFEQRKVPASYITGAFRLGSPTSQSAGNRSGHISGNSPLKPICGNQLISVTSSSVSEKSNMSIFSVMRSSVLDLGMGTT